MQLPDKLLWREAVVSDLLNSLMAAPTQLASGFLVGRVGDHGRVEVVAVLGATHGGGGIDDAEWHRALTYVSANHPSAGLAGWYVSRPGHDGQAFPVDLEAHQERFGETGGALLVIDAVNYTTSLNVTEPGHGGRPVAGTVLLAATGTLLGVLLWILAGADSGLLG